MGDEPAKEVASTRLSPDLLREIDRVAKRDGVSRSDIIADSVERHFSASKSYTNITKDKPKKHGNMKQEDYEIIEVYKEVFGYTGRIFYPAVLSTIKARRKDGMTQADLTHCIRVAPIDEWISERVRRSPKMIPPINELLSQKMAARLLQIPEEVSGEDTNEDSLEGYKRAIIDHLWKSIPPQERDRFREGVLKAGSFGEVNHLASPYRD